MFTYTIIKHRGLTLKYKMWFWEPTTKNHDQWKCGWTCGIMYLLLQSCNRYNHTDPICNVRQCIDLVSSVVPTIPKKLHVYQNTYFSWLLTPRTWKPFTWNLKSDDIEDEACVYVYEPFQIFSFENSNEEANSGRWAIGVCNC